jgi:hypothetical protein
VVSSDEVVRAIRDVDFPEGKDQLLRAAQAEQLRRARTYPAPKLLCSPGPPCRRWVSG